MRDLSDTVEMATLDKEMAEERVSPDLCVLSVYYWVFVAPHSVRDCRLRWRHSRKKSRS